MTGVLGNLPPLTWRGVQYPVAEREVSFQQEGARHTIQYRDGDFVEQTGAHGLTFSYLMPMRESVAKGPFKHLFEQGLPQLLRDALNRTPGPLFDPIYGAFRCVPVVYRDTTDVAKRCGTDVRVEFLWSPEVAEADATIRDLSGVAGIKDNAGAMDAEVAKADWKQEPPPEPTVDVLQAVDGFISQGLAQVGKAVAALHDFAYKCEKIEATCDRALNPDNWGIRDASRRNREAAMRAAKRVNTNPATQLRAFTTKAVATLSDVARDAGMTVQELLQLNPVLARMPYVRAGTLIIARAAPTPPVRTAA